MSKPIQPIELFFRRYGAVIFIVAASLMLAGIIFICYNTYIIATAPDENVVENPIPASFDSETAKKIRDLHDSAHVPVISEPLQTGRTNPFVE